MVYDESNLPNTGPEGRAHMTQRDPAAGASSLDARYGRHSGTSRARARLLAVVVAVALLAWAAWAAFGSTPDTVGAQIRSYEVESAHLVAVTVDITRTTSTAVECTVTAIATDHTPVGQHVVRLPTGDSGTESVTLEVRTEREATTADVGDCR